MRPEYHCWDLDFDGDPESGDDPTSIFAMDIEAAAKLYGEYRFDNDPETEFPLVVLVRKANVPNAPALPFRVEQHREPTYSAALTQDPRIEAQRGEGE